ncbi:hypothetical protein HDU76_011488 [Blyttiomyces sp. JEL0837]|nr:hypothetical protein HDU76_011488 [Blyttiomyces sp. JEL0837]
MVQENSSISTTNNNVITPSTNTTNLAVEPTQSQPNVSYGTALWQRVVSSVDNSNRSNANATETENARVLPLFPPVEFEDLKFKFDGFKKRKITVAKVVWGFKGPFWHKAIDVTPNDRNWWMRIPDGNNGFPIEDSDRFTLHYFNEKPARTWSRETFEFMILEPYSSQVIYAMRGGDKMSFTLEIQPSQMNGLALDMHTTNPFSTDDVTKYINNGTFEYIVPSHVS